MNKYIVIVTVLLGLLLPFELRAQTDDAGLPRVGPPQYILYGRLFRHVASCQRQAMVWDRMGRDGSRLRGLYQRQARLSAAHSAALIAIAQDCESEVAAYDQRAREIILAARGANAGIQRQPVPPPPAELDALQQSRDKAVLRARDRLEAAFGRNEFLRFESFVQSYLAPRIRALGP